MYLVRAGRLEAVDGTAGAVSGEFRRGDALGELALLTGSPRSASVRAEQPSRLTRARPLRGRQPVTIC